MNENIEKVFELPMYARLGILVFSVVSIISGYWFLSYTSHGEEYAAARAEVDKLTAEVREKEGIARSLPQFESEVARLDVELKKALSELPDKKEIAQLLDMISDKARNAGLEVHVFKPQKEQKKDFYAEVPITIEVGGSFHQVATFFDEVGNLERIVNLSQLNMVEPKSEESGLQVKTAVVATSFRFLDENERPKEDGEGEGKKRAKTKEKKSKDGGGGAE